MFFNIGEDVIDIQNFICSQSDSMGEGYTIAPVSTSGSLPVKYYWWCGYSGDGVPNGWYAADSDTVIAAIETETVGSYYANVSFAKGEGLVAFMSASDMTLQGSGEVLTSDLIANLNHGYTGVANPYATSLNITNITLSVADSMGEGYTIAPVSSSGSLPVKYYWWCGYAGDGVPDGWYTADSDTIVAAIDTDTVSNYRADVTFDAGQTLVAFMSASGSKITFKTPLK